MNPKMTTTTLLLTLLLTFLFSFNGFCGEREKSRSEKDIQMDKLKQMKKKYDDDEPRTLDLGHLSTLKEAGIIGSTCWSEPTVYIVKNGVKEKAKCFSVDEIFYPILTSPFAYKSTVRQCEMKNALDYSGVKPGCYDRCKEDTFCIHLDNR